MISPHDTDTEGTSGMIADYAAFLRSKQRVFAGQSVPAAAPLPAQLYAWQAAIVRWPFAGIGSEGYEAIRLGRRYIGIELKPSYARVAAQNLRQADALRNQGTLFTEAV